jgi:hypothetical protein
MGRFLTPDPYKANNGASGDPSDPQSWNRYTYSRNDPTNRYDPTGTLDCAVGGVPCSFYDQWLTLFFGFGGPQRPLPADPPGTPLEKGETAKENLPGFDTAIARVLSPDCAKALGGTTTMYAANGLFKTHYFFQDGGLITAPTDADGYRYNVGSVLGFKVTLNANTYLLPTSAPAVYGDGTTGTKNLVSAFAKQTSLDPAKFGVGDFHAAFLLHELGHTLGAFKDDSSDFDLSLKYDQVVADNCFKDMKE